MKLTRYAQELVRYFTDVSDPILFSLMQAHLACLDPLVTISGSIRQE